MPQIGTLWYTRTKTIVRNQLHILFLYSFCHIFRALTIHDHVKNTIKYFSFRFIKNTHCNTRAEWRNKHQPEHPLTTHLFLLYKFISYTTQDKSNSCGKQCSFLRKIHTLLSQCIIWLKLLTFKQIWIYVQ